MTDTRPSSSFPGIVLGSASIGATVALAGAFWDDGWHTDRGRDSFFIPPHLAIYAGITVVGAVLALRLLLLWRREGRGAVTGERSLTLAAVGVVATLGSAPIDNFWHIAYGRDAVLWSPPHMLGIVGTLTLGAALMSGAPPRSWSRSALAGLVLAAATFAVAEYDTDVPQFAATWYLPALVLGACVGFTLVRRLDPSDPFAMTRAAAAHLAFYSLVVLLLWVAGFPAPAVPTLLPAAAAADFSYRRGGSPAVQILVLAIVLAVLTTIVRGMFGQGVDLGTAELLIAAPFVVLCPLLVVTAAGGTSTRMVAASATAIGSVALAGPVAPGAEAHDPGQGPEAGTAALRAHARGRTIAMGGNLGPGCGSIEDGSLVARRAGRVRRSTLRIDGCRFAGTVVVPEPGRWFIYASVATTAGPRETWLPLQAGGTQQRFDPARFVYVPERKASTVVKDLSGVVVYALMAALLLTALRLTAPEAHPAMRTAYIE